jgi:hypothetical protein
MGLALSSVNRHKTLTTLSPGCCDCGTPASLMTVLGGRAKAERTTQLPVDTSFLAGHIAEPGDLVRDSHRSPSLARIGFVTQDEEREAR